MIKKKIKNQELLPYTSLFPFASVFKACLLKLYMYTNVCPIDPFLFKSRNCVYRGGARG